VIKSHIQSCDIALVLVSQGFLDSDYCQNVEIEQFLAGTKHLFPVILSPCDWKRHEWLASRQFLPGGDQTIEEHYRDDGERKCLFLTVREQLLERARLIRQNKGSAENLISTQSIQITGKTKIAFCNRLGEDWKTLADYLQITPAEQSRFSSGDEGRGIWIWLENRQRLTELPDIYLNRHRPARLSQPVYNCSLKNDSTWKTSAASKKSTLISGSENLGKIWPIISTFQIRISASFKPAMKDGQFGNG
jgi:hypothetical protein